MNPETGERDDFSTNVRVPPTTGLIERARTRWTDLRGIGRLLRNVRFLAPQGAWNSARLLQELAAKLPNHLGIAFQDQRFTWLEVDQQAMQRAVS